MATESLIGLPTLWIYVILLLSLNTATIQAVPNQAQILLDFRSYVVDDQNMLTNWQKTDLNTQPCNWTGVKCSSDGFVTGMQRVHCLHGFKT